MATSRINKLLPFMTHMLCCQIETATASAPIEYFGPFAPCLPYVRQKARGFEPRLLILRMAFLSVQRQDSSPESPSTWMRNRCRHFMYYLRLTPRELLTLHAGSSGNNLYLYTISGAKRGTLMVPRRKFFTAASVPTSKLTCASQCPCWDVSTCKGRCWERWQ